MQEEMWVNIPEFSNYDISSLGEVYNRHRQRIMRVSTTNHGHPKISLINDYGERITRSVALLVAEAFIARPNILCDHVTALDGNPKNVAAENLVWRPAWFAWKYVRQIKEPIPDHYKNLMVENTTTEIIYDSIVEAGMTEGLLFDDIWRSTYTGNHVHPNGSRFEILE